MHATIEKMEALAASLNSNLRPPAYTPAQRRAFQQLATPAGALAEGEILYRAGFYGDDAEVEPSEADRREMEAWQIARDIEALAENADRDVRRHLVYRMRGEAGGGWLVWGPDDVQASRYDTAGDAAAAILS